MTSGEHKTVDAAANGRPQQQGAAGPATSEQQQRQEGAPFMEKLQGCYRERPDLPDARYRLLHSMDNAHSGGAVASVRFDQSGRRLASCGSDGTAAIWDTHSGRLLHRLRGHTRGISDVAWSPDGRYLATASDDTTLRVWDATSGACLRELKGHTHYVACCAFNAGSNMLVSGGFDEVLILWDVRHARPIKVIPGHSDPVSGVHFSGQPGLQELIASCSFDGLTRVWHTGTGRCQASLVDAANPPLSAVRFTPNGQYLLTTTLDSRLVLWDHNSRAAKREYSGHLNQHSCIQACFVVHLPDKQNKKERQVASGSEDHHVYLWDLHTKQIVGILRGRPSKDAPGSGHCGVVMSVDASQLEERPLIASGGQHGDGSIKIWAHDSMSTAAPGAADDASAVMDA